MAAEKDAETLPSTQASRGLYATKRMCVATIALHPHLERAGERAVLGPLERLDATVSRTSPDFLAPDQLSGSPLSDRSVSRQGPRFLTDGGGLRVESPTPIHLDGGPGVTSLRISPMHLDQGAVVRVGRVVLVLSTIATVRRAGPAYGMVGRSDGVERIRDLIDRVAAEPVPVLVRGESGTGKELVARAIHGHGARRDGPFVALNMGALPTGTAVAELFGHQRGSFTGAVGDHDGAFGAADGGTLFLDEIGAADQQVQGMLLRALELGEIRRVGGKTTRRVDVRVVAATDVDLERSVQEGSFRLPLLHRLAGFEIEVPPLRSRREDIGALFVHFLRASLGSLSSEVSTTDPPWLPADVMERLLSCDWPGNLRQLKNVAAQIAIANRGLPQARLPDAVARQLDGQAAAAPSSGQTKERVASLDDLPDEEVLSALSGADFEPTAAARALGVAKSSVYQLMERLHIRTAGSLTREEILAARSSEAGDLRRMASALRVSRRGLKRRMTELELPE